MPITILKLLAALLIGSIIGAEREYRNKSAGFRTLILMCMGSCIFTILSQHFVENADRIASTIVTGIGFIGAGVIFKEDKSVVGITTAATIWITASLGMACGLGEWQVAIAGATITLAVLITLFKVQFYIDKKNNMREYRIVTTSRNADLIEFEEMMKQCNLRFFSMGQQVTKQYATCSWRVYGTKENQNLFMQALLKNENVAEVGY
jgi:putative Mg2+ transporter-C (MgtC) family protein